MSAPTAGSRIEFIDVARLYAMALVFFGHFIEEFMLLKNPAAASQYKFVYSFHMVLFIVLAGYVAKERVVEISFGDFAKNRFFSRLLPFIFFTALMMIPPIFIGGKFYGLELPSVAGYLKGLQNTVFGIPSFCVPSWFLLLVVGLEIVDYVSFRFLKRSNGRILVAAVLFYLAGYLLNLKLDIFNPLKGRVVGWNYLFIHEAITLYGFYLIGRYLGRKRVLAGRVSAGIIAPIAVAAFLIVLFTYRLNNGPFAFHVYDAVVILFASHGHILLFPLTALAGCALILCLASLTPAPKILVWMGQNCLILMCLNGVFYHYINPCVAKWVLGHFSGSGLTVFTAGVIVTSVSLVLCIPFVYLFDHYVPQLVGKPKRNGPLMNSFIRA
ncbi:acyltransferase family protein [uncultured Desulfosarcina sp.]|uniref:acyltransferase family protein n=1 Tax=uncultured Desulfosarcina sp. TaxID=218289 RepID=UPI0029C76C2B|nr:acyltransferase family protein [uncultured Desulfosarcina sp.]